MIKIFTQVMRNYETLSLSKRQYFLFNYVKFKKKQDRLALHPKMNVYFCCFKINTTKTLLQ